MTIRDIAINGGTSCLVCYEHASTSDVQREWQYQNLYWPPTTNEEKKNIERVVGLLSPGQPRTRKITRNIANICEKSYDELFVRHITCHCWYFIACQRNSPTPATKQKTLDAARDTVCSGLQARFSRTIRYFYAKPPFIVQIPEWKSVFKTRCLSQTATCRVVFCRVLQLCFAGNGRLNFVEQKSELNVDCYRQSLAAEIRR